MAEQSHTTDQQPVPVAPGKVIAVHLAYESRAAQRGRRPQAPSYFLKPASSLAGSGGEAVRPAGTELLAFEGEIALVIGRPACNVPLEQAWDHVASVTAANDLGLYDLRAADKGSNLRNKGRDGYTPIGPSLIDARTVRPDELRVRTWVDGELVQQDTTADEAMIFPLAQFIADLSQHVTLEEGDVILTGTPAGSSVVQPGSVMEVEVDAPRAAGSPSSGRLLTRVVEDDQVFDPAVGSVPAVDDKQREEAWGSREAAGLPVETEATEEAGLPEALLAKLRKAPTAGLSAELRRRGLNNVVIEGVHPQCRGTKMVGPARTLRFVPNREDLFKAHGGGFNAQKQVFDQVGSGEVIVIEARGETGSGTLGDILALRARSRGAAGVVTDGGVRDDAAVEEIGLPAFSQTAHPAVLGRRHVPWEGNVAVACGNATVLPGDIIVGDDDGVIVIPRGIVEEVVDEALAKEHQDEWVAARVSEGNPIDGLFPPTGRWKQEYERWVQDNPPDVL